MTGPVQPSNNNPATPPANPPADPPQNPPADPPNTQNNQPYDQGGQSAQRTQQTNTTNTAEKVEDLPEWAQRIIRETRNEAAQHRTSKQQAEQEKQSTLDAIATALGLKQDEAKDPEKLAADLAAARQATKQRAVELAVYRNASAHGGDPDSLLDSRSFTQSIEGLDPDAADFSTRVADAVKNAVQANPKLASQNTTTQHTPTGSTNWQGRRPENAPTSTVASGREIYEQKKGKKK